MPASLRPSAGAAWVMRAFSELDYGIVVIDAAHEVVFRNPIAADCLAEGTCLRLDGALLRAATRPQQQRLDDALAGVLGRGHRKMLMLGDEKGRIGVAAVPLYESVDGAPETPSAGPAWTSVGSAPARHALLTLSRRRLCEPLTLYAFAREHGLSPMEEQVLLRLCLGLRPPEIAAQHGSTLNTVRAQVMSIRAKTGFVSVSRLINWISMLPPMLNALGDSSRRQAAPRRGENEAARC